MLELFGDAMFVSGYVHNRICGLRSTDSSLPKKRKIQKRIIYHDNGMSSCSSYEKKKKQRTDPHSEDKKKKQHEVRMNIRNEYISVETQTFLE